MIYKIPDELVPYLEYIPEEMLSDVITDALKAAIFAPSVPGSAIPARNFSI